MDLSGPAIIGFMRVAMLNASMVLPCCRNERFEPTDRSQGWANRLSHHRRGKKQRIKAKQRHQDVLLKSSKECL